MNDLRQQFVHLNPERHSQDETGKCLVCGQDPDYNSVLCPMHLDRFKLHQGTAHLDRYADIHEWVLKQEDFNGVDPYLVFVGWHGPPRPIAEEIYEALRKAS